MLQLQGLYLYTLLTALLNPNTSDPNQGIMWIVIAALVVSAILIVVFIATSASKKKKKRK